MGNAVPRPTDSVTLIKKMFGIQKRPKVLAINNWDCRPTCKAHHLRSKKIEKADEAVDYAKTVSELKKALQARSMLKMYMKQLH